MAETTPETQLTTTDAPGEAPALDTSAPTTAETVGQAAAAEAPKDAGTEGLEQLHCPHCGSTQLSQDSNGVWHCAFCRATFRADDPRMIVVAAPGVQRADQPVIDTADLLTGEQERAITEKFEQLDSWYRVVIVLETVNTITENVDYYARRRAQELGVGQDATDNGIYILIVGQPHHVQIEVGNGIAPYVNHDFIQGVVNGTMLPAFRSGDYVTGVGQGATQLAYAAASHGKAKPAGIGVPGNLAGLPSARRPRVGRLAAWIVIAAVIVLAGGSGLFGVIGSALGGFGGSGYSYNSSYDSGSGYDSGYDSGSDFGGSDFGGGDFDSGSSGGGDW